MLGSSRVRCEYAVSPVISEGAQEVLLRPAGLISGYNDAAPAVSAGPRNFGNLLIQRVHLEGFIVLDHFGRAREIVPQLAGWMAEGRLNAQETVVEGFEQLRVATRVRVVLVAVFGDAHAHAEAFDAVIGAAEACGVQELWSLGDMTGRGPDPEHVVARTRKRCAVALMGNHDYGATGSAEPTRFGKPASCAVRSIELARERLSGADVQWMLSRKPAARRGDVRCWHGSPRNAVHEYVGASNAAACLAVQRAALGLVGHTHVAAAWQHKPGGASAIKVAVGVPLDLTGGKWLLNPGAVGAPSPSRLGWWDALDLQAADGAYWLLLDLQRQTATWRRAPYDPAPARLRARALGLDDAGGRGPVR